MAFMFDVGLETKPVSLTVNGQARTVGLNRESRSFCGSGQRLSSEWPLLSARTPGVPAGPLPRYCFFCFPFSAVIVPSI
jgi:hypothetical protein